MRGMQRTDGWAEAAPKGVYTSSRLIVSRGADIPAYPVLLLIAFVFAKYIESWAPLEAIIRPLLVAAVVAALAAGVASFGLGRHRGALLVAGVGLLAYEPLLAAVLAGLAAARLAWARGRAVGWAGLTRSLNALTLVVLIVTVAGGIAGGAIFAAGAPDHIGAVDAPPDAPDVYLVLLDAYPRQDTLTVELGWENNDFIGSMEDLGFAHAAAARSNYNSTALTLASMLNGQHASNLLADAPATLAGQARRISTAINDAKYVREFRSRGYEIVSIPSPSNYLTLYRADRLLDSGHLSVLDHQLTQGEALQWLFRDQLQRLFLEQHRGRILSAFQSLEVLSREDASRPRFVLAHVLAPHPPFVFAADGDPTFAGGCLWTLCHLEKPLTAAIRTAAVEQVTYVNSLAYEAAAAIIRNSTGPVVILVFSDHGLRHDLTDRVEAFRTLLLTYTPGHEDVFPADATPINYLPRLLNEYFEASLPLSSDASYFLPAEGGPMGFLSLEPINP
jgi:hypothetical protein